jgi:hypothetical protein
MSELSQQAHIIGVYNIVADPEGTEIEGVFKHRLNLEKLEQFREAAKSWIAQLPNEFRCDIPEGGGGWSFLNMCVDKDGHQWTGMHVTMDQMFALTKALGMSKEVLPREMWSALPGGMPYIQFSLEPIKAREEIPAG